MFPPMWSKYKYKQYWLVLHALVCISVFAAWMVFQSEYKCNYSPACPAAVQPWSSQGSGARVTRAQGQAFIAGVGWHLFLPDFARNMTRTIKYTGCPISKFPLCFLSFSRVLEHIQRNFWHLFNSPGNLLHDSHKNFENWFRNSWDNWGQSWHLWHQNYFFDSV